MKIDTAIGYIAICATAAFVCWVTKSAWPMLGLFFLAFVHIPPKG